MKIRYWAYLLPIMLTFTACTDHLNDNAADTCIGLNASVGEISTSSRAVSAPFEGSVPTDANQLIADVWFSTESGTYEATSNNEYRVPYRTEMTFDGTLIFAKTPAGDNLKYNTNQTPVYCVGLYPKGKWISTDNTTATADITGNDDLMFASQIQGNWADPLSNRNLVFEHQLTWLKVCICATTQDAAAAWGKITSIQVTSAKQAIADLDGIVTFSSETSSIEMLKTTPQSLHTTMKEIGSVFCSPVPNSQYTLTIQVQGRTIKKDISLTDKDGNPFKGSTQGKQFVLALYFNKFDVVEGVCTLTAWNDQNEDLYLN